MPQRVESRKASPVEERAQRPRFRLRSAPFVGSLGGGALDADSLGVGQVPTEVAADSHC